MRSNVGLLKSHARPESARNHSKLKKYVGQKWSNMVKTQRKINKPKYQVRKAFANTFGFPMNIPFLFLSAIPGVMPGRRS